MASWQKTCPNRGMPLRHQNIVAWQRADDLFIKLHQLTRDRFPSYERFELSSQLRRAAYSVAANIVEGVARRSTRERAHFLNIAEASLAEVAYCVHVARRLGYISPDDFAAIDGEVQRVFAPLTGLLRSTRPSEPRE